MGAVVYLDASVLRNIASKKHRKRNETIPSACLQA